MPSYNGYRWTPTEGFKLGSGASGQVYYGFNTEKNNAKIVIKEISERNLEKHGHSKAQALISRIRSEYEVQRQVKNENIVRVLDYFVLEDAHRGSIHVIVQEYCNEGNLNDYLMTHPNLSDATVAQLISQMAAAIHHLHRLSIVHRDIKPDNVFLHIEEGTNRIIFKLGDFGMAKILDDTNMTGTLVGTPLYMAPEIAVRMASPEERPKHGIEVDLWSLGCIIYKAVMGNLAFEADTRAEMNAVIQRKAPSFPFFANLQRSRLSESMQSIVCFLLRHLLRIDRHERLDIGTLNNIARTLGRGPVHFMRVDQCKLLELYVCPELPLKMTDEEFKWKRVAANSYGVDAKILHLFNCTGSFLGIPYPNQLFVNNRTTKSCKVTDDIPDWCYSQAEPLTWIVQPVENVGETAPGPFEYEHQVNRAELEYSMVEMPMPQVGGMDEDMQRLDMMTNDAKEAHKVAQQYLQQCTSVDLVVKSHTVGSKALIDLTKTVHRHVVKKVAKMEQAEAATMELYDFEVHQFCTQLCGDNTKRAQELVGELSDVDGSFTFVSEGLGEDERPELGPLRVWKSGVDQCKQHVQAALLEQNTVCKQLQEALDSSETTNASDGSAAPSENNPHTLATEISKLSNQLTLLVQEQHDHYRKIEYARDSYARDKHSVDMAGLTWSVKTWQDTQAQIKNLLALILDAQSKHGHCTRKIFNTLLPIIMQGLNIGKKTTTINALLGDWETAVKSWRDQELPVTPTPAAAAAASASSAATADATAATAAAASAVCVEASTIAPPAPTATGDTPTTSVGGGAEAEAATVDAASAGACVGEGNTDGVALVEHVNFEDNRDSEMEDVMRELQGKEKQASFRADIAEGKLAKAEQRIHTLEEELVALKKEVTSPTGEREMVAIELAKVAAQTKALEEVQAKVQMGEQRLMGAQEKLDQQQQKLVASQRQLEERERKQDERLAEFNASATNTDALVSSLKEENARFTERIKLLEESFRGAAENMREQERRANTLHRLAEETQSALRQVLAIATDRGVDEVEQEGLSAVDGGVVVAAVQEVIRARTEAVARAEAAMLASATKQEVDPAVAEREAAVAALQREVQGRQAALTAREQHLREFEQELNIRERKQAEVQGDLANKQQQLQADLKQYHADFKRLQDERNQLAFERQQVAEDLKAAGENRQLAEDTRRAVEAERAQLRRQMEEADAVQNQQRNYVPPDALPAPLPHGVAGYGAHSNEDYEQRLNDVININDTPHHAPMPGPMPVMAEPVAVGGFGAAGAAGGFGPAGGAYVPQQGMPQYGATPYPSAPPQSIGGNGNGNNGNFSSGDTVLAEDDIVQLFFERGRWHVRGFPTYEVHPDCEGHFTNHRAHGIADAKFFFADESGRKVFFTPL